MIDFFLLTYACSGCYMLHGSYSSMIFIVFYTGEIIYQSFFSFGSTYSSKEHLHINWILYRFYCLIHWRFIHLLWFLQGSLEDFCS